MEFATSDGQEPVEVVDGVYLTKIVATERMSAQHVRIEPGASVPEHEHPHEQVGFVYEGRLTFLLADGSEYEVGPGDSFGFASGEPHAAENRGSADVRAVDVFSPPRTDPDWLE